MLLLGCIADDLTGATDLGITLAREGLSVIQVNGIPASDLAVPIADAVVVALKSRTIPPADAIAQAHRNLAVQALWAEFDTHCDYLPLADVAESRHPFAEFDSLDFQ